RVPLDAHPRGCGSAVRPDRDPAPGRDPGARHDGGAAATGGSRCCGSRGDLPPADGRRGRHCRARCAPRRARDGMSMAAGARTRLERPFREASVLDLLAPKWITQRRRLSQGSSVARSALLTLVATIFWVVLFTLMYRMLRY